MGAFERLQAYSSGLNTQIQSGTESSATVVSSINANASVNQGISKVANEIAYIETLYSTTTPLGYFLVSLHKLGYAIVEPCYTAETGVEVTQDEYLCLTDEAKAQCKQGYGFTELAKMLLADKDCLVIAGAGSGKTTALVFKIMKDILTGESLKTVYANDMPVPVVDSIFVGTFLKSGADELKATVAKWQRKLGYLVTADRIQFGTLHAEFKRALNSVGIKTPIGDAKIIEKCLKSAISALGIKRTDGYSMGFEDTQVIASIVTYYRNRLGNARYSHPACLEYGLYPPILDKLVQIFAQQRGGAGVMDFEDLQELLYKFLYVTPNKALQDFVANRYSYIYLDEFQDTSEIQYAIIKFYARGRLALNRKGSVDGVDGTVPAEELASDLTTEGLTTGVETHGKIVAVGDDDQCIYSWRGSTIEVMTKLFPKDFEPNMLYISKNYRCPKNILDPVIPSIELNSGRFPKKLRAAKEGGEFSALSFKSITSMSENLMTQIDEDIAKGRSVAIICRTNFDGVIPAFLLEMRHKHFFSVSSNGMTLNSALPKTLLNVCRLFMAGYSQYTKSVLEMFVSFKDRWSVKQLCDKLKSDASVGMNTTVWSLPAQDIEYTCPALFNVYNKVKGYLYDANGKKRKGGDIEALMFVYYHMLVNVFDGDSSYCVRVRAYLEAVLYLLKNKSFENVYEFLDEVTDYSDRLTARIKADADISIVTVHEFKGKERDSVYIWHDSELYFPSNKTDLSIKEQVEEERRVHYIACTRAREKCVIYTLQGMHGMFLDEMRCNVESGTKIKGSLTKVSELNITESCRLESQKLQENLERLNGQTSDEVAKTGVGESINEASKEAEEAEEAAASEDINATSDSEVIKVTNASIENASSVSVSNPTVGE